MEKKRIYRLKKEHFANVAQRLNVTLDGRLEDMRKALSEYYSETDNDSLTSGPSWKLHTTTKPARAMPELLKGRALK